MKSFFKSSEEEEVSSFLGKKADKGYQTGSIRFRGVLECFAQKRGVEMRGRSL